MASWIRALLTSTLLAFCIETPPAQAAPAPIVFDFEDGLHGGELSGTAQRVQTQLLGGEWAIFGDGFNPANTKLTLFTPLGFRIVDGFVLPWRVSFDLFTVEGEGKVEASLFFSHCTNAIPPSCGLAVLVEWSGIKSFPPFGNGPIAAFIDNVTVYPVPEPSTLLLLAVCLAALMIYRRRIV